MVKKSASSGARPSEKKKVSLTHGGKARSGGAHGGKAPSGGAHRGKAPSGGAHRGKAPSGGAHRGKAPSAHGGKAHKDPWAGDMVAVGWRHHENETIMYYTGSVVNTTGTDFEVTYDEDGSTHCHPVSGTQWRYDFSIEKNCLTAVRTWAKGNRVPVRKEELTRMGATYRRLARCRSKEQMFKGWRKVVTAFWTAHSRCLVISPVDA